MPIIKSAIKRMRQEKTRRQRQKQELSRMRSLIKNIYKWMKSGKKDKAEKIFSETQKAIDTAAKKNIIHKNNAARKKSQIAKVLGKIPSLKAVVKKKVAGAAKKPKAEKKPSEKKAPRSKKAE